MEELNKEQLEFDDQTISFKNKYNKNLTTYR